MGASATMRHLGGNGGGELGMGVAFHADGLAYEDSYDCGYLTFDAYRIALAKVLSPLAGIVYEAVLLGTTDDAEIDGTEALRVEIRMDAGDGNPADLLRGLCPIGAGSGGLLILDEGVPGTIVAVMTYEALNEMLGVAYGPYLASFLSAPDSEGELSSEECAGILRDLGRLGDKSVPAVGHNYGETILSVDGDGRRIVTVRHYPMHSQFVGMFRHCAEAGVPLSWG